MRYGVYNLEFPEWCSALTIAGCRFRRRDDYEARLLELQHPVGLICEFVVTVNNGAHSETAIVDTPEPEVPAVLDWPDGSTAIRDILLLLSLFTLRDVIAVGDRARGDDGEVFLLADPRMHPKGFVLQQCLPASWQPLSDSQQGFARGFTQFDNRLEVGLNQVYATTRTREWLERYRGGHYLFLLDQAVKQQRLEASFVQCYTIWEHLFSIDHQRAGWSDERIRKHAASRKIAFLLQEHGIRTICSDGDRERLQSLADARNRLVHFGRFPAEDGVRERARFFTELTELLVARTLGLTGGDRDTLDRLDAVIHGRVPEYVRLP
jgi:hypothetical protein